MRYTFTWPFKWGTWWQFGEQKGDRKNNQTHVLLLTVSGQISQTYLKNVTKKCGHVWCPRLSSHVQSHSSIQIWSNLELKHSEQTTISDVQPSHHRSNVPQARYGQVAFPSKHLCPLAEAKQHHLPRWNLGLQRSWLRTAKAWIGDVKSNPSWCLVLTHSHIRYRWVPNWGILCVPFSFPFQTRPISKLGGHFVPCRHCLSYFSFRRTS